MKKFIVLMCVLICGQAMAQDGFESLGGVRLGMTASEVEQVMTANGMKQTETKGRSVFYEGNEIELYGVLFNKARVEYTEDEVSRVTFGLFMPRDENTRGAKVEYEDGKVSQVRIDPFGRASGSTPRKLFRMLHERLKRASGKVSDENIRYHYRYTFRTADGTQYVRASIEEALQGEEGYHLYLSCDRNKHYQ
ncbi:hypothetical protein [Tannerella sp.]|uniref:hypothetical protein n=1 Tax=Tannerella sp. TaxID=2382127 RepID=UPI0026DC4948|nr:hypothetical protein [Tannerella sp.]MDO4704555.1 hypothetical protein [Tannerella sp.]